MRRIALITLACAALAAPLANPAPASSRAREIGHHYASSNLVIDGRRILWGESVRRSARVLEYSGGRTRTLALHRPPDADSLLEVNGVLSGARRILFWQQARKVEIQREGPPNVRTGAVFAGKRGKDFERVAGPDPFPPCGQEFTDVQAAALAGSLLTTVELTWSCESLAARSVNFVVRDLASRSVLSVRPIPPHTYGVDVHRIQTAGRFLAWPYRNRSRDSGGLYRATTVIVEDLRTGRRLRRLHAPAIDAFSLQPDGKIAALGTYRGRDTLWVWDANGRRRVLGHPDFGGSFSGRIRMRRDRVAYVEEVETTRRNPGNEVLKIMRLHGRPRTVARVRRNERFGTFDFDKRQIVWTAATVGWQGRVVVQPLPRAFQ